VSGVAADIQNAIANAGGSTRAYVGDGGDISASALTVTANATTLADAFTKSIGVAIGSFSGAQATATVSSTTDAYIGKNADAATGPIVSITLAGATTLSAISSNTATAQTRVRRSVSRA